MSDNLPLDNDGNLNEEDARMLIKAIEDVEREEANLQDQKSESDDS